MNHIAEKVTTISAWIVSMFLVITVTVNLMIGTLILPFIPSTLSRMLGWIILLIAVAGTISAILNVNKHSRY